MRRRISAWIPIVLGLVLGALYEGAVLLGSGGLPLRIPIPYAVPIFDTPFALVAAGVGYLCLERHRLRQVLHNLPAGDWSAGERGIACDPRRVGGIGAVIEGQGHGLRQAQSPRRLEHVRHELPGDRVAGAY